MRRKECSLRDVILMLGRRKEYTVRTVTLQTKYVLRMVTQCCMVCIVLMGLELDVDKTYPLARLGYSTSSDKKVVQIRSLLANKYGGTLL